MWLAAISIGWCRSSCGTDPVTSIRPTTLTKPRQISVMTCQAGETFCGRGRGHRRVDSELRRDSATMCGASHGSLGRSSAVAITRVVRVAGVTDVAGADYRVGYGEPDSLFQVQEPRLG